MKTYRTPGDWRQVKKEFGSLIKNNIKTREKWQSRGRVKSKGRRSKYEEVQIEALYQHEIRNEESRNQSGNDELQGGRSLCGEENGGYVS